MSPALTTFKHLTTRLFSKLPVWPPSLVMTQGLNKVLKPLIANGSLTALTDKSVIIMLEDLGLRFSFTFQQNRFVPISQSAQADLSIRSTMSDFYLLATRQEDPDTLFFNRRLVIEGDTELGLVAKNTMDSLEIPKPLLAFNNALKALDVLNYRSQNKKPVV